MFRLKTTASELSVLKWGYHLGSSPQSATHSRHLKTALLYWNRCWILSSMSAYTKRRLPSWNKVLEH
ncbi:hypothetical protein scyTo_0005175 [Scyliorhinus torazame]|uniref:Uncharacterized protein n=1 Tax=Scyliorhinus torazame TaxID=75743 RepID=A0A401P3J8_SCYTO|nr:hypothetical protein [Scyliorhinus torazame]